MKYFLLHFLFTLLHLGTCNSNYAIFRNDNMQRQGFRPISRRENEEIRAICGKSRKVDETDDEDDEYDDAVEGSADDEKRCKRSTGGQLAEQGQFPWAGILIRPTDHRFCSLTLISRRHAITAGHCLLNDVSRTDVTHQIKKDIVAGKVTVGYGGNCHYGSNVVEGLPGECTESNIMMKNVSRIAMIPTYIAKYVPDRAVDDIAIIELVDDITGDSGCGMFSWLPGSDRATQFGVMHGGFPGLSTFADL
ncbi:hypothetical protein PRIPAC_90135, partial [Pristionchus pacificus]|uniref:Trypsin n=1 Tax=Pristionchus pacificus TaxID=54126 RepID=A0A2A6CVI3_PRIPA